MSTHSKNASELDMLVQEAESIYQRQTAICKDITAAVIDATLTAEEIDALRVKLCAVVSSREWQSNTWVGKYVDIKYDFSRFIAAMYHFRDTNLQIDVEVEAETENGPEVLTVTVPVQFYVPQKPGIRAAYRIDQYKPLTAKEGINITPEMVTLLSFEVAEESAIDDEGERYTFDVLEGLQLVLDQELLELALHDYLMQQPDFENCTQIQVQLDNVVENLGKDLMNVLRDTEEFPGTSKSYHGAALWKFNFLSQYNQQIVTEAVPSTPY